MIELLFLGTAAFAGGAHAVRKNRARHAPSRRPPRTESLLVKAWNAAGAPYTEETMLADAVADLGGRAVGLGVRRVWRRGRQARPWAEGRWQHREADGRTATFIRRRNRRRSNAGAPADAAQPGARRHPGAAPPLPQGRSVPQLPPGSPGGRHNRGNSGSGAPARPGGPIPMPPGSPAPGTPARPAARSGRVHGRAGARRTGRAPARMRITGPFHLEAPDTDVEFLETCQELQQLLRGVGVAVEEWTDDVIARRLPPIITNPLTGVHEGLVDAAACTALATMLFESWFAEAREVAAAGIEFTGDDPV